MNHETSHVECDPTSVYLTSPVRSLHTGRVMVEAIQLPGLIAFRELGGRREDLQPNDVRPYWRIMERDMRRFQFPPFGVNMLRAEYLGALMDGFDAQGKTLNAYAKRALE
jgi:hypothetical protein